MTIDGNDYKEIDPVEAASDAEANDTIFPDIVESIEFIKLWLGKTFLSNAVADHNHDGSNSSRVSGTSGGSGIVVGTCYRVATTDQFFYVCEFTPEAVIVWPEITLTTTTNPENVHVAGRLPGSSPDGDDDQYCLRFAPSAGTPHADRGGPVIRHGGFWLETSAGVLANGISGGYLLLKTLGSFVKVGAYTGNGTTQDIGVGFEPKFVLVWASGNSTTAAAHAHIRTTSMTGTNSRQSDGSGTINTTNGITAINAGPSPAAGFSIGAHVGVNENTVDYVYLALTTGNLDGEFVEHVAHVSTSIGSYPITISGLSFVPQLVIAVAAAATSSNQGFTISSRPTQLMGSGNLTGGSQYNHTGTGLKHLTQYVKEFTADGAILGTNFSDDVGTPWATGDIFDLFFIRGGSLPSSDSI